MREPPTANYQEGKQVMRRIIGQLLLFGFFYGVGVDYAMGVTAEIRFTYRNGYTYDKELQVGWENIAKDLQNQIALHPENAELHYSLATLY